MMKSSTVKFRSLVMFIVVFTLILTACGNNNSANNSPATNNTANNSNAASTKTQTPAELVKITQVTSWYPQPETAAPYVANEKGFYKDAGMEMRVMAGGPGISTIQMVASGEAQFGMANSDDLLLARQNGIPVVAIGANFQGTTLGLVVHTESGITSLADLDGNKAIVGLGANYWEYLKSKYQYKSIQEQAYSSFAVFLEDKNSAIQGIATSEPFMAKEQGFDVTFLPIGESGYDPYMNIIFTTEDFIEKNPELVKGYLEATYKGWAYYKDNVDEVNNLLIDLNPDLSVEKMLFSLETTFPMIFEGDAATNYVGYINRDRFQTLAEAMVEIGVLNSVDYVDEAFTLQFLQ